MIDRALLVAWAAALAACGFFTPEPARLDAPTMPPDIRAGCALVEQRCTRCHTIDRVIAARVVSPRHWLAYVRRMRLQPQSGIAVEEESPIASCLVYRSFGPAGVAALAPHEGEP
jgi:hypothetical protein